MFRRTLLLILVLLTVLAMSIACTPTPDLKIVDKRQVYGNKTTETMRADNSQGNEVLIQDMPVQKSFHYQINIMSEPGETLNESVVREMILKAYQIANMDKDKDKVCVLPVEVPAGDIYEYDIEWTEIWREGTIETDPGGEQVGTYRILVDMDCQTIGQRVVSSSP